MKLKKGDLVEPTEAVVASYSNYGGRPVMHFEPGMLGVVRHIDMQLGGVQVEFFHPATGCMEKARTTKLKKAVWPDGLHLPPDDPDSERGWWSCGSLNWKGALTLLQAVAMLRPEYLRALHPTTLRIPYIHASRLRHDVAEMPEGCNVQQAEVQEAAQCVAALAVATAPA